MQLKKQRFFFSTQLNSIINNFDVKYEIIYLLIILDINVVSYIF